MDVIWDGIEQEDSENDYEYDEDDRDYDSDGNTIDEDYYDDFPSNRFW